MNFVDRLFISVLFWVLAVLLFLVSKGWDFFKLINVDIVNHSYFWIVFVLFVAFVTCWHLLAASWQRYAISRLAKKSVLKDIINRHLSNESKPVVKSVKVESVKVEPVDKSLPVFEVVAMGHKPLKKTSETPDDIDDIHRRIEEVVG